MSKSAARPAKSRYQLRGILGKGGMGVVYKAYDTATDREVTLKTIHDVKDRAALELFQQEYSRQKSLSHPNIVDIFDIGELEENGEKRPYFTMPLLRGSTLDELIRSSTRRLTVERAVEIAGGVTKGLQAAHDARLVHRDIKPSNIFVLEDDSIKILDFGVAHLVDKNSTMGFKGTLLYMSPEQVQNQKPTPLSDIFSLGVVCYEALTRRRPFEGATVEETVDAILHRTPVPACELNPAVNWPLSQVIHAALAKEPWRRFASAREFGEALQKALRGEPIERFNPARIQPRLERARKAFQDGDSDFASEILAELESECWIAPEILGLRREVDLVRREKEIQRLLGAAKQRLESEEFPLALQKIEEIFRIDPQHSEALTLKDKIEARHRSQKIADWFNLARRHVENQAYEQARQALQGVLQADPNDSTARRMLADIDRQEKEDLRKRQLKDQLYHSALQDWQRGEVTNALTKLERLLELDRIAPEHQSLYNQVRSAHDALQTAYQEVRQHLQNRNFTAALALCDQALAKYPQNTIFQALKFDAEAGQRQELSEYIAEIDREVDKEPDLDRKVALLELALGRFPLDHFRQSLKLVRAKRDLVNSIMEKARAFEANGQLGEALGQLEILRNIDNRYPGLSFEVERLRKRRDQQARSEAKMRWVEQIDRCLGLAEYERASQLAAQALADFPSDTELLALDSLARQGLDRSRNAQVEFERSRHLFAAGRFVEGIQALRRANELDDRNTTIRANLVEQLLGRSRMLIDTDWRAAEQLIDEALRLDPASPAAKSLRLMVEDHERAESIDNCLSQARSCQASGDGAAALAHVERGLEKYPKEQRLLQLRATLQAAPPLPETRRFEEAPAAAAAAAAQQSSMQPARTPSTPPSGQPASGSKTRHASMPAPGVPKPVQAHAPAAPRGAAGRGFQARVLAALTTTGAAVLVAAFWVTAKISKAITTIGAAVFVAAFWLGARFRLVPAAQGDNAPRRKIVWVVAAAGVLLVAGSAFVKVIRRPPAPAADSEIVRVRVETSPSGATVYVDGEKKDVSDEVELKPGTHTFKAVLAGYVPLEETVSLSAGTRDPIHFVLRPYPPSIRISSDLSKGQAILDGQPAGELVDGQFALEAVGDGRKQLKVVSDGGLEVTIGFETSGAKMPQLVEPLEPKQMQAVVVLSYLGKARVYCSCAPAKLTIGEQQIGEVPVDGLELNLDAGVHTLLFGEGRAQKAFAVEVGPAPSVIAALSTDRNIGTLEIVANQGEFRLFIDGRERRYTASNEKWYVRGLEAKPYTVRIGRDGFRVQPEQAQVEILKGRVQRAEFRLEPIPVDTLLHITGGPPDAEVIVAGETHRTGQDGGLSVRIRFGKHKVEVRKQGYRPWAREFEFAEGRTVEISGKDITLSRIVMMGTAEVRVEPATARVTYRRASGGPEIPIPSSRFDIEEGQYTFRASAPEHEEKEQTVSISSGKPAQIVLALARVERKPVILGMESWEQTWSLRDGWHVRKGAEFTTFRAQPPVGLFSFTAARPGGLSLRSRHVRWLINYRDSRNFEEFDIDGNNLTWRRVAAGREVEKKNQRHGVRIEADTYTLRIEIDSGRLIQQIHDRSKWIDLPALRTAGAGSPANGKFGFRITGDEELRLANFRFTGR